MSEKLVALGLELANTLERVYNIANDNSPMDPNLREAFGPEVLEKVAEFRKEMKSEEVEVAPLEATETPKEEVSVSETTTETTGNEAKTAGEASQASDEGNDTPDQVKTDVGENTAGEGQSNSQE